MKKVFFFLMCLDLLSVMAQGQEIQKSVFDRKYLYKVPYNDTIQVQAFNTETICYVSATDSIDFFWTDNQKKLKQGDWLYICVVNAAGHAITCKFRGLFICQNAHLLYGRPYVMKFIYLNGYFIGIQDWFDCTSCRGTP
jgi:hypothetical protein